MNIQIDPHTLLRAQERGTNREEILQVLKTGQDIPVKYGKLGKYKIFDFKKQRNKKYYEQKRVELIYLIEDNKIITVTVFVFYGKWE